MPSNLTSDILRYEQGELDNDEVVEFFQKLVDTGLAYTLQGHYGRTAEALIQSGWITAPEKAK